MAGCISGLWLSQVLLLIWTPPLQFYKLEGLELEKCPFTKTLRQGLAKIFPLREYAFVIKKDLCIFHKDYSDASSFWAMRDTFSELTLRTWLGPWDKTQRSVKELPTTQISYLMLVHSQPPAVWFGWFVNITI